MSGNAIWFVLPLLVGLVQPVIWRLNVAMARGTGDMEAAAILHGVGLIVGLGWVGLGLRGSPGLAGLAQVPWWAWLGGAVGVTGMAAINRTIPVLGVSSALALLVAAQFISSVAFEHYGWLGVAMRPASPERWLGAVLLALGAWLISR